MLKPIFSSSTPGNRTTSATLARELAAAARARGVGFVDAPVSGGQPGAEKGTLTVMCGGEPHDFAAVEPLIGCFINFLPLRTKVSGDESGSALLQHVRTTVLDADAHQECPFQKIVEAAQPDRGSSQNPLGADRVVERRENGRPVAADSSTKRPELALIRLLVGRVGG